MSKAAIVPDQDALKRVGEGVRRKLANAPNTVRVPGDKAEIYAVGDFLTPDECRRLIAMIDVIAQPSELFDQDYSTGFRTSYSGNLEPRDPFVAGISRRIDDLIGVRPAIGEAIQGQRYLPGQQFKPHHDWFHVTEPYWPGERKRGGQRSWTAMAYLNPVQEGGSTDFPELGVSIQPRPGALMLWNNAHPDGTPNGNTLHTGTPVIRGVKYVITKWYRTRPWG